MSYVLAFAPDARSQWQGLDIELQERVLDEADRIASSAPGERVEEMVLDFTCADHLVFLQLVVDHRRHVVNVTGVVALPRKSIPPSARSEDSE